MYKAILKRKNGKEIITFISSILTSVYWNQPISIDLDKEEYRDITPNNIINHGGFSTVFYHSKTEKTCFEFRYHQSCPEEILYYQEI